MIELQQGPVWMIASLGLLLLIGRFIHAFGVGGTAETKGARTTGMALTFMAIALSAVFALGLSFV